MMRERAANPPPTLAEQKLGPSPLREGYSSWRGPANPKADLARTRALLKRHHEPQPDPEPVGFGLFHGSIAEALEHGRRAGLPEPKPVIVRGREAYAVGGMYWVPFAGGVLIGPAEVVADRLGELDEEKCAAMIREARETSSDGGHDPQPADPSEADAPAPAAVPTGEASSDEEAA
jgi:hypothetical protein